MRTSTFLVQKTGFLEIYIVSTRTKGETFCGKGGGGVNSNFCDFVWTFSVDGPKVFFSRRNASYGK